MVGGVPPPLPGLVRCWCITGLRFNFARLFSCDIGTLGNKFICGRWWWWWCAPWIKNLVAFIWHHFRREILGDLGFCQIQVQRILDGACCHIFHAKWGVNQQLVGGGSHDRQWNRKSCANRWWWMQSPHSHSLMCRAFQGSADVDLHGHAEDRWWVAGRKEFDSFMTPILGAKLQMLKETSADQKLEWQLVVVWSVPKIANQSWFWISSKLPKKHGSKWRSSWSATPKICPGTYNCWNQICPQKFVLRVGIEKASRKWILYCVYMHYINMEM